jgi:hypothetical protein
MILLTIGSFDIFWFGRTSLFWIGVGVLAMDLGVQLAHVSNQSRIPESRPGRAKPYPDRLHDGLFRRRRRWRLGRFDSLVCVGLGESLWSRGRHAGYSTGQMASAAPRGGAKAGRLLTIDHV